MGTRPARREQMPKRLTAGRAKLVLASNTARALRSKLKFPDPKFCRKAGHHPVRIFYWLSHLIFPRARFLFRKSKEAIEYFRLHSGGNVVEFSHDGAVKLLLPPISFSTVLWSNKTVPHLNFVHAAEHEPTLRLLVSELFTRGLLSSTKSIVDIGCWLGDNSLPWAKRLDATAMVFGIDPSEDNLQFVRRVAGLNGLRNLALLDAVCSDTAGLEVGTSDDISHATFSTALESARTVRSSTTLDELIPQNFISEIGLLHLDVEGMEKKVILGAKMLIKRSRPLVIFERHLSDEVSESPVPVLQSMGYQVFMINEVIVGNRPDCRNFFCFPRENQAEYYQIADGIFPTGAFKATEGARLLAVGRQ